MMPIRQLEALMWSQACEAMDRADRLHRQFFHRACTTPCWEAPCDIFETDEGLTIVIALPGVEPDQVKVTLSAGVLIVSGERSMPPRGE
jgi:HSP20 family protein